MDRRRRTRLVHGLIMTSTPLVESTECLVISRRGNDFYINGEGNFSFLLACREIIDDIIKRVEEEKIDEKINTELLKKSGW